MDKSKFIMLRPHEANDLIARIIGAATLPEVFAVEKGQKLQDAMEDFYPPYVESPEGGWLVIEAVKAKGFCVQVNSTDLGWRATAAISKGDEYEIHSEEAGSMELAACLLALKCFPQPTDLAPEAKEAILKAALETETSGF
jgi:hypothetical protein